MSKNKHKGNQPQADAAADLGVTVERTAESITITKDEPKAEPTDDIVYNEGGIPMFRRMAPTTPAPEPKKERNIVRYKDRTKASPREPGTNAALLEFPTDRWGITKDLKKALTHVASRIAGDEHKKALVDETLKILVLHLNAKYKSDAAYKATLNKRDEAEVSE